MMNEIRFKLNITYYFVLLLAILSAMLGYVLAYRKGIFIETHESASVIIYSIIIVYALVSIPLSLKLFSNSLKKISLMPNHIDRKKRYITNGIIRLGVLGFGLVCCVLGYYLLQQKGLLWISGIFIISLIFCNPSPKHLENDMDKIFPERTNEENNENILKD